MKDVKWALKRSRSTDNAALKRLRFLGLERLVGCLFLEAIRAVAAARAILTDTVVFYNQTQHLLYYRVRGASWRQAAE